jgi:hypothetical protein
MPSTPPPGRWPAVRRALLGFIALALVTYGVFMAVRLVSLVKEREAADEVVAAVPPSPGQPAPEGEIRLERTACYGFCPAYTVSITSGGRVHYDGKEFVRVHGGRDLTIDPEPARALFAQIEAARPFAMASRYFIGITDNPTATLTITLGGRTKTIVDYPPCHGSEFGTATPLPLCELEKRVDEVAGVADLVECRDGEASYCRSP